MGGFTAGLVAGCLLGVGGTFLLFSLGAAFSAERARLFRVRSIPGTLLSTIVLLFLAAFSHRMNIGKDATMLLLLLAIMIVSRLEGLLSGLIATVFAAFLLVVWFFPPAGSFMIKSSSDRLSLALFLLIATLGSHFLGRRERSAP